MWKVFRGIFQHRIKRRKERNEGLKEVKKEEKSTAKERRLMIRFTKDQWLRYLFIELFFFPIQSSIISSKARFLSDLLQEEANTKSKRNGGKVLYFHFFFLLFPLEKRFKMSSWSYGVCLQYMFILCFLPTFHCLVLHHVALQDRM